MALTAHRMRRLLLLIPFFALLCVPLYNVREPVLWGFPFFYWYQLMWLPLSALITYFVYRGGQHS